MLIHEIHVYKIYSNDVKFFSKNNRSQNRCFDFSTMVIIGEINGIAHANYKSAETTGKITLTPTLTLALTLTPTRTSNLTPTLTRP